LTFDGGTLQTTAGITSDRDVTLATNGGTIDTNGFNSTFNGVFSGVGDLTKSGLGVLKLSGMSTYTGDTFIDAGTLLLGDANILPDTTMVTVAAGATFDLDGFDDTIGSLAGAAGRFVTLSIGTLTTGDATPLTEFAGVISGSGGLQKQGSGIFRLSGINTYTGPTTVTDGILELAVNEALADQTAVTVNTPGTLALVGTVSDTIGSLAGDGSVTLGTGTLTTGFDNSDTVFSGDISGTGGLVKIGTGTFTLSGVNTYFGGTAINGGTVSVSNYNNLGDPSGGLSFDGGTLLTTAGITSSCTVTLNAGGGTIDTNTFDSTLSGVIGGAGRLTKNGLGTLTLGGVNTYTGGTTINAGTVSVSNDNNLSNAASTLTFDGGTLLTTAGINSSRDVTLNAGGGTIDTNGFDSSFSGAVTGLGNFTKDGAGTLTFSGPLDGYTGDTTINAGILESIRLSAARRCPVTSAVRAV
jgi:fibronectin-binding autotransporter adhesin